MNKEIQSQPPIFVNHQWLTTDKGPSNETEKKERSLTYETSSGDILKLEPLTKDGLVEDLKKAMHQAKPVEPAKEEVAKAGNAIDAFFKNLNSFPKKS